MCNKNKNHHRISPSADDEELASYVNVKPSGPSYMTVGHLSPRLESDSEHGAVVEIRRPAFPKTFRHSNPDTS